MPHDLDLILTLTGGLVAALVEEHRIGLGRVPADAGRVGGGGRSLGLDSNPAATSKTRTTRGFFTPRVVVEVSRELGSPSA